MWGQASIQCLQARRRAPPSRARRRLLPHAAPQPAARMPVIRLSVIGTPLQTNDAKHRRWAPRKDRKPALVLQGQQGTPKIYKDSALWRMKSPQDLSPPQANNKFNSNHHSLAQINNLQQAEQVPQQEAAGPRRHDSPSFAWFAASSSSQAPTSSAESAVRRGRPYEPHGNQRLTAFINFIKY